MEKISYCPQMDKSFNMESSSDEPGDMWCSDLDMPLFTSQIFEPMVITFLQHITDEQWRRLTAGHTDGVVITLLSTMCQEIVEAISVLILEVVAPQVLTRLHRQIALGGSSSSTNTSTTIGRNYYRVTEEDIQASLGNSFHLCFGTAVGAVQEKSHDSDKLVELFAAEVKKRVNRSLALISGPLCLKQLQESTAELQSRASLIKEMVHHITNILRRCRMALFESTANPVNLDSDFPECSYPDEVTSFEDYTETFSYFSSSQTSVLSSCQWSESPVSFTEEQLQQDLRVKTFVTRFLWKLVEHVAVTTRTSVLDVDFYGMWARLRERGVEELSSTLSQTAENIHIHVFEQLCQKFGSAKLLQAAMVSSEGVFEEAVVQTLKAQLQKPIRETSSHVKIDKRFFNKRSSKVSPACEANTSVEQGSTALPSSSQTCPAVNRMFLSVARILRKLLSSCISSRSQ